MNAQFYNLIGKSRDEVKNSLGIENFYLTFDYKDIQKYEKEFEYELGGPLKILMMARFDDDKLELLMVDFVFMPHEKEYSINFFNALNNIIENGINPKPKKRKDRKKWTPFPVEKEYNIFGEDLLIRKRIVWKDYNGVDIGLAEIKQIKEYAPYKPGLGMLISRLMYVDAKKDEKDEIQDQYGFFSKYFQDEIDPSNLNYYLYVYIDDLNSLGVFDHLDLKNDDFEEILLNHTNNFNIFFKNISISNSKPDYNTVAIAHSMYNNCKLDIQVDPDNWNESSLIKRVWILYHELSHDLFNIEHGRGGPIMDPVLPSDLSRANFVTSRLTLINYLKLIKFNETCKLKGKEKLKKLLEGK